MSSQSERLEGRARYFARKAGLIATKSRQAISLDNQGGFRLVDANWNYVVAGERFDLNAGDVIEICRSRI